VKIQTRFIAFDLVLGLINALWAIPHASIKKALEVAEKLGWETAGKVLLPKLPATFRTGFQREIETKILEQIFEIDSLPPIEQKRVREAVADYSTKQNGFVDIAVAGCVLLVGHFVFGDRSLDIFGIGRRIASGWARDRAESHFFLGKSLGHAFYQIAPPPEATTSQIVGATAIALLSLAVLNVVFNVTAWPLQQKLGLRQKQLNQLIESLDSSRARSA